MRAFKERSLDDDAARDEVVRAWIDNELVRLTTIRAQEMRDTAR